MSRHGPVRDALEAAKLFAIRYPHAEAVKLIRMIDAAIVELIERPNYYTGTPEDAALECSMTGIEGGQP